MNSNSDNPKVGKAFQLAVKEWFEQARKCPLPAKIDRKKVKKTE